MAGIDAYCRIADRAGNALVIAIGTGRAGCGLQISNFDDMRWQLSNGQLASKPLN